MGVQATTNEGEGMTTDTNGPRLVRLRTAVIASLVSLVVGVGVGAGGKPASTATGQPQPSTPPVAVVPSTVTPASPQESVAPATPEATPEPIRPVTVKGTGSQNTKPFPLQGGDYSVVMTGTGDGNVMARLQLRGGDIFSGQGLFNEIARTRFRYETTIYGIEPGSYYLDVTVDNAWVVTFTPLA